MGNQIGVFFDIDGTLSRESMLILHFKKLMRYGIIPERVWEDEISPLYRKFDIRFGQYDDYLDAAANVYQRNIRGINKAVIDFTAGQIVEEFGDVVYKYTRERLAWHKRQGHKVFFISGSPDFLIAKMAKKYEITDFRATNYLVDEDNCYTGKFIPMWDSVSKSRILHEVAEAYDIDLAQSFAYGDTNGDFSMMQLTAHPTVINPSYKLLGMLRADSDLIDRVSVIIERKDVIYRLTPKVLAESALDFNGDFE